MVYRSGFTALTPVAHADGSAIQPGSAFSSEASLGWYRSAASVLQLSYGTLVSSVVSLSDNLVISPSNRVVFLAASSLRRGGSPTATEFVDDPVTTYTPVRASEYHTGGDGSAIAPLHTSSDESLGWYSSANSTMDLSYGTLQLPSGAVITGVALVGAGTALAPSLGFSSEESLGWYRSAASIMELSYGTLKTPSAISAGGNIQLSPSNRVIFRDAASIRRGGSPTATEFVDDPVTDYVPIRASAVYITGNALFIATAGAPASGTDTGTAGEIRWAVGSGTTYLYLCASANSWFRTAMDPF